MREKRKYTPGFEDAERTLEIMRKRKAEQKRKEWLERYKKQTLLKGKEGGEKDDLLGSS